MQEIPVLGKEKYREVVDILLCIGQDLRRFSTRHHGAGRSHHLDVNPSSPNLCFFLRRTRRKKAQQKGYEKSTKPIIYCYSMSHNSLN